MKGKKDTQSYTKTIPQNNSFKKLIYETLPHVSKQMQMLSTETWKLSINMNMTSSITEFFVSLFPGKSPDE